MTSADLPHEPQMPERWWHRLVKQIAASRAGAWFFSLVAHKFDGLVLRITSRRHSLTSMLTGIPVVILTTTGAQTGKQRSVPLLGFTFGGRVGLIASNWGRARQPSWYRNLRTNPTASLWMHGIRSEWTAREADEVEREQIWNRATIVYPGYNVYAARAQRRRIPVLVLERLRRAKRPHLPN